MEFKFRSVPSIFIVPIGICLIAALLTIGGKWNVFLGSSQSSEFVHEKFINYEKSEMKFRVLKEIPSEEAPEAGDLIEIRKAYGLYDHWAICVEKSVDNIGESLIVHLIPNGKNGPEIRKDVLKDVVKTSEFRVNNLKWAGLDRGMMLKSPSARVKSALSKLSEFQNGELIVNYDVLKSNCEHFATSCAFIEGFSTQAELTEDKHFLEAIGSKITSGVDKAYGNHGNPNDGDEEL